MSPTLRAFSAALLLAALPARLPAQLSPEGLTPHVVPGAEQVRVLVPIVSTRWKEGLLIRADSDSVMVYRPGDAFLAVPAWQVERMQRPAGRDHTTGAIHGLLIGLAACVPLIVAANSGGSGGGDGGEGAIVAVGALITLPPIGLLAGAIVGSRSWRDVPVPGARPPAESAAAHGAP